MKWNRLALNLACLLLVSSSASQPWIRRGWTYCVEERGCSGQSFSASPTLHSSCSFSHLSLGVKVRINDGKGPKVHTSPVILLGSSCLTLSSRATIPPGQSRVAGSQGRRVAMKPTSQAQQDGAGLSQGTNSDMRGRSSSHAVTDGVR